MAKFSKVLAASGAIISAMVFGFALGRLHYEGANALVWPGTPVEKADKGPWTKYQKDGWTVERIEPKLLLRCEGANVTNKSDTRVLSVIADLDAKTVLAFDGANGTDVTTSKFSDTEIDAEWRSKYATWLLNIDRVAGTFSLYQMIGASVDGTWYRGRCVPTRQQF